MLYGSRETDFPGVDFFDFASSLPFPVPPPAQPAALRAQSPLIRACDVVLALLAIAFFAPLMLLVALAVKLEDRGPALFAQRRLGHNGRYFDCYKFRSMATDAEARLAEVLRTCPLAAREWHDKQKLTCDPRVTRVGAFIRRTSLDELPQFFNVLLGTMSLVGPRPITEGERSRYGRYLAHYCSVVPGITGLWQISGRTETSYQRRVALDVLYIRHRGALLYLLIIAKTVPCVILARGAH